VKFSSMAGSVSEGIRATLSRLHAKADCILVSGLCHKVLHRPATTFTNKIDAGARYELHMRGTIF
jgi:hypothetical protein